MRPAGGKFFGFWLLAFGFWLLAFGFWLLALKNSAGKTAAVYPRLIARRSLWWLTATPEGFPASGRGHGQFCWNKIEQPKAGPQGGRQDAWSLPHRPRGRYWIFKRGSAGTRAKGFARGYPLA